MFRDGFVPAYNATTGEKADVPEHWLGDGSPFPGQWRRADEPAAPSPKDNKAAWVDYAIANGATREDAEAMTKDALIDTYAQEA